MAGYGRLIARVSDEPLSRSLPTVLTAADSIGDDDLARLIRLELGGYVAENPAMSEDAVVPEYRAVPGNWYDDFGRMFLVKDPKLDFVNVIRLRHGVAELEGFNTAIGPLAAHEPAYAEVIREGLNVEVSVFQFQVSSVAQVLSNIRVHVLDELASRREAFKDAQLETRDKSGEILLVKPQFYGVGVDLRALWRHVFGAKE